MDILASLIKTVFGSKADKDRKQIEPYVEKIKAVYPTIEALSNDELRARSQNLKKQIADYIAADEARIVELKGKLERPETSLEEKEKISKEVDELTRRIDDKIEDKLDEILPEATDTAVSEGKYVLTANLLSGEENLALLRALAVGDTLTVKGTVVSVSEIGSEAESKAVITNQDGKRVTRGIIKAGLAK